MRWRSIKSAPLDGTRILAGYRDGDGLWRCVVTRRLQEKWFCGMVEGQPVYNYSCTHWTPIKEPKT